MRKTKILLTIAFILCCAVSAPAADRVASTSGSGSTCSVGSPCSLNTALSGASPGDTVLLRAGTYAKPTANPPTGTSSAFVTIRNYGTTEADGETVTVQGWPAFYGTSRSYIKIWGRKNSGSRVFTIDPNYAIEEVLIVDNGDHHMWFEGLILTRGAGQGIYLGNQAGSGNNTVIDNEIHTNGDHFQLDHGIYIASASNLVERNILRNNACYGLQLYNGSGGVSNNIARYNLIYANGQAANTGGTGTCGGVVIAGGSGNQFYGNIVRDNIINADGLSVYGNASNTLVYNNVFYNNRGASANLLINSGNSGSVVRNNAFSQPTSGSNFVDNASITKSNNFCTTAGGTSNCSDSGASAGWVDPGNGDFGLTATSALRNAGTASIASGVTACGNGTPDIGPHEEPTVATAEVGLVNSTTVVINFNNPCTGGLLPLTGITGFTIQEDTGGGFASKTITGVTTVAGSNQVRAVVSAGFTGGSTARFSFSPGNLTDSALIGGVSSQRVNAATDVSITNNVGGGGGITFTVVNARAYEHDCGEVCTRAVSRNLTASGAVQIPLRGSFLMRIGIGASGGDPPAQGFSLWYDKNGGSDTLVPTKTTGTEDIALCPAPNVQNGQATTQQITSGTFAAGQVRTIASGAPSVDLANGGRTEIVYSLCIGPSVTATDVLTLKMKDSGGTAITNTAQGVIRVSAPTRAEIEVPRNARVRINGVVQ